MSDRRTSRNSITRKFQIAFLIAAIVPLLAFGVISYLQLQNAVTSQSSNVLLASSHNKRVAIDVWLNGLQEQLTVLAHIDVIRQQANVLAVQGRGNGESNSAERMLDELFRMKLTDQSAVNGVYLLSPNGKILYSLIKDLPHASAELASSDFLQEAKSKSVTSDIVKSPFTRGEALLVAHPLRDAHQNVQAILVFEANLNRLFEIMSEKTGLGESGEAYLTNREGFIISKTQSAQATILTKRASSAGVLESISGKTAVGRFETDTEPVLGAYVWYPRQSWVIASEMRDGGTELFGWRLLYFNVLMVLVLSVVMYAFARTYARRFAKPILNLTSTAEVIAAGNLDERVQSMSTDEIGRLGEAFNTMVDSLSTMNRNLQDISLEISSTANEMLAISEEQEQITIQQSSAVSETSATVEELSVSSRQVTQSSQSIMQQVEGTARKIMFLSEKAQEINKFTTVIEEIAQQIHLLSLNASIEAARAGEHGKGFEVVASEIRKLSEKANKQTSEISSIVSDIQDATTTAVLATEQAVNGVRSITLSIQQQDTATNQISLAMSEINTSMKQSLEGTKQTVRAVESLNHITQTMTDVVRRFHK